MFRYSLKDLILIGVMGGVWGFSEMALGSLMHAFRFPLRGLVLSAIGFFAMISLKRLVGRPGSIVFASLVAMSLRMMSPSKKIAYIMLAIFFEAAGWELIWYATLGKRKLLVFFSGLYTGFLCAVFFMLSYVVMGGMSWEKALKMYEKQAEIFCSLFHISINPALAYISLHIAVSLVFMAVAVKASEKLISRFRRRNA